jgi:beta-lactamase class A
VDAAVGRLLAQRPKDAISLAALDTTTNVQVGSHAAVPVTAASVFKLTLLEGYLLRNQDRGEAPGAGAAAALTTMIENSDNAAADAVFAALGGSSGVRAALPRLGTSRTDLGPAGQWGLSTTTATDQLRLLANLVSPASPLSPGSRAYALRLLGNVEADQRWGVGRAADPGTDFANKNGWLQVDADGGRWAVGSVGVVDVAGHQVLLAVLTEHGTDQADGIGLVESVSAAVADALRGRRPAATTH